MDRTRAGMFSAIGRCKQTSVGHDRRGGPTVLNVPVIVTTRIGGCVHIHREPVRAGVAGNEHPNVTRRIGPHRTLRAHQASHRIGKLHNLATLVAGAAQPTEVVEVQDTNSGILARIYAQIRELAAQAYGQRRPSTGATILLAGYGGGNVCACPAICRKAATARQARASIGAKSHPAPSPPPPPPLSATPP